MLKDFMYSTVYVDKDAKREEKKVDKMIEALYERLCADPTLMPNFYMQVAYHQGMDRAVADYISGMSDEFATRLFEELFVPQKCRCYKIGSMLERLPPAPKGRTLCAR